MSILATILLGSLVPLLIVLAALWSNSDYATGGHLPAPPSAYVEPHWAWRERLEEALATLTVADLPRWPESGADWFASESWRPRPAARTKEQLIHRSLVSTAYLDDTTVALRSTAERFRELDDEISTIRSWDGATVRVLTKALGIPPATRTGKPLTPVVFDAEPFSESDGW